MIRPPFLRQGYAGKRVTPAWAAPFLAVILALGAGSIGILLFSSTISDWLVPASTDDASGIPYAVLDVAIIFGGMGALVIMAFFCWLIFYEKRPIKTLGFWPPALPRLLRGAVAGFASVSLVALILVTFSDAELSVRMQEASAPALLMTFMVLPLAWLVSAATDEIIYRGFIFQTIGFRYGLIASTIVTSLLWAVTHVEMGMPFFMYFASMSVFSFFLCIYAVTENSLWGPIGFNAAWNFSMHTVFDIRALNANQDHVEVFNALDESPGLVSINAEATILTLAILITLMIMLAGLIVLRAPGKKASSPAGT